MKLKTFLYLFVSGILLSESLHAQVGDRLATRRQGEEMRQDEYALSLRRRDWLKDRLILQLGFGSKYPVMGETGFGYGAGIEYITRYHLAFFATGGLVPGRADQDMPELNQTLEGMTGYKVGLAYYLFPKSPLHLGISASYGTVWFDHKSEADASTREREVIPLVGWQGDVSITFLTNEWYYLTFNVGMYYAPNAREKSIYEYLGQEFSYVVNKEGIPKQGMVFGIGIGFALPELFPDDTEERRRERERRRQQGETTPARGRKR